MVGRQEADVSVRVDPSYACCNVVATCAVVVSVPMVTTKSRLSIVSVMVSFCAQVFAISCVATWRMSTAVPPHLGVAIFHLLVVRLTVLSRWGFHYKSPFHRPVG